MLTPRRINREALITSHKQLVDYLAAGARPAAEWGIGAEMEKLVLDAQTGAAAEFSRIEALLNALAGQDVFRTDARGGTTTVRNEIPWPGIDRVMLVDTPGLGEVDGAEHAEVSAEAARDADLVLLVVEARFRPTVNGCCA